MKSHVMSTPVTKEILLKQPIEKVWKALTDKEQMKAWYFDIPDFELKEGAVFHFNEGGDNPSYLHACEILKIIPPQSFSHTWTHPSHSKGSSVLTWQLTPQADSTLVQLEHRGLESFADAGPAFAPENYDLGWEGIVKSNLKNYLNGAVKLKFKTTINAHASAVWQALWADENYRKWTRVFSEGSCYKGELKQGARVHFLGPEGGGIYSDVVFCNEPTLMVFKHQGVVLNFEEQPDSPETEQWQGMLEQYQLQEKDGVTSLQVMVDVLPKYQEYFEKAFNQAIVIIKEIAEAQ